MIAKRSRLSEPFEYQWFTVSFSNFNSRPFRVDRRRVLFRWISDALKIHKRDVITCVSFRDAVKKITLDRYEKLTIRIHSRKKNKIIWKNVNGRVDNDEKILEFLLVINSVEKQRNEKYWQRKVKQIKFGLTKSIFWFPWCN